MKPLLKPETYPREQGVFLSWIWPYTNSFGAATKEEEGWAVTGDGSQLYPWEELMDLLQSAKVSLFIVEETQYPFNSPASGDN